MNWRPLPRPGFLRHNEAAFDEAVGRTSPPSLKMTFDRGGVGAWYRAKDIDVHPANDYRVVAWVRPHRLGAARAYITAFFLDHAYRKIRSSERRSRWIRGPRPDEPWTEIAVELTGGVARARWIGITCVIEQSPLRESSAADPRPINHRDVNGAAWFDDISVIRLPRATFRLRSPALEHPGSVFEADEPIVLEAVVADPEGADLKSTIEIRDHLGSVVLAFEVPVTEIEVTPENLLQNRTGSQPDGPHDSENGPSQDAGPLSPRPVSRFVINDLAPGRYEAGLTVQTDDLQLLRARRPFLKLGRDVDQPRSGSGFGVVLDRGVFQTPKLTRRLIRLLSPGSAKIPFWHKDLDDRSIVYGDPSFHSMVNDLSSSGIDLVGSLVGPPKSLGGAAESGRSLLDVLGDRPENWQPYLSLVLARYGPYVHSWQLGDDRNLDISSDPRFRTALQSVKSEMLTLIHDPRLVTPASPYYPLGENQLQADVLSLTIPQTCTRENAAATVIEAEDRRDRPCWAVIEALDSRRYDRRSRLSEFARRIITARANGAEVVFAHQPWTLSRHSQWTDGNEPTHAMPNRNSGPIHETWIDPAEEFLILRTLARSLGGLTDVSPVWIDHDVTAYLFVDPSGNEGAVVAWLTADQGGSRSVPMFLGPDTGRIDLLAGSLGAEDSTGSHALDSMPVILAPVDPWIVRMQSAFALNDANLRPAIIRQRRSISLTNTQPTKMHGVLRLSAPAGIEINPRKIIVELDPGRTLVRKLSVKVASNFPAGPN
ncbi:MAG: hypothetical protein O7D94_08375, partial [Planctomycetota bacterium]|nr:hypothetical protein [Planctomycetota bacterium]